MSPDADKLEAIHDGQSQPIRILIVGNDQESQGRLRLALSLEGLDVGLPLSGQAPPEQLAECDPALVLCCQTLAGAADFELLRQIRLATPSPLIVILGTASERIIASALDAGADDCMTMPVSIAELEARFRALLRRKEVSADRPEVFGAGELRIAPDRKTISVRGKQVRLTQLELRLLVALVRRAGQIVPYQELSETLFGQGTARSHHHVHRYASRISKKIELPPGRLPLLVNVRGEGYVLARLPACLSHRPVS